MRALQCLEYARKVRGKGHVVFKYCGQIRLTVHCGRHRLSVTQVASDHSGREGAPSLLVAGIPVNVLVILFVQVAPVDCFKGFEFNVQMVELSGNVQQPGFRSWKVDDDALHDAVNGVLQPVSGKCAVTRAVLQAESQLLLPS